MTIAACLQKRLLLFPAKLSTYVFSAALLKPSTRWCLSTRWWLLCSELLLKHLTYSLRPSHKPVDSFESCCSMKAELWRHIVGTFCQLNPLLPFLLSYTTPTAAARTGGSQKKRKKVAHYSSSNSLNGAVSALCCGTLAHTLSPFLNIVQATTFSPNRPSTLPCLALSSSSYLHSQNGQLTYGLLSSTHTLTWLLSAAAAGEKARRFASRRSASTHSAAVPILFRHSFICAFSCVAAAVAACCTVLQLKRPNMHTCTFN